MTLSGNKELLDRELVAFFASRLAPHNALALAQEWAYKVSKTDTIIISGFHSPIEREVLSILLSEGCCVIVALSRTLYRKIPPHLQTPYNEGRLLFISFREHSRPSFASSQHRNWATADIARKIVFTPFEPQSQLSALHYSFQQKSSILG